MFVGEKKLCKKNPMLVGMVVHHPFDSLLKIQVYRLGCSRFVARTNILRCAFHSQESMLNGRLEPTGVVDGFTADLGASGSFCPKHATLPVTAFFFKLSDDNAPSPYLVSLVVCINVLLRVIELCISYYCDSAQTGNFHLQDIFCCAF